jgi:uncharacterized protein VirK/YbjX
MQLNRTCVMRAAFSVLPTKDLGLPGNAWMLVVGNMQGIPQTANEIKVVTQGMERTRPQNIMMTVLQGLAQGWHLQLILGVADSHHVYANYRSLTKRVGQSYDLLWQELGALERATASHWQLIRQWIPRSESEVPSSKRSQLRRKNAVRQKIFDQTAQHCMALGE